MSIPVICVSVTKLKAVVKLKITQMDITYTEITLKDITYMLITLKDTTCVGINLLESHRWTLHYIKQ